MKARVQGLDGAYKDGYTKGYKAGISVTTDALLSSMIICLGDKFDFSEENQVALAGYMNMYIEQLQAGNLNISDISNEANKIVPELGKRHMPNPKIEVRTPFGVLIAEDGKDDDYPGIVISLKRSDDEGEYIQQLAVVESTIDKPEDGITSLRALLWDDFDNQDYTTGPVIFTSQPNDNSEGGKSDV